MSLLRRSLKFSEHMDTQCLIVAIVAFSQGYKVQIYNLFSGMQLLSDLSIQYMIKDDFQVGPAQMGIYMSMIQLPWVVKPIWGLITDAKPLFGYRRKSYLILFGFLGTVGWVLLAFYGLDDLNTALGLLFLIQFSTCFRNVVGEAILVEIAGKGREEQKIQSQTSIETVVINSNVNSRSSLSLNTLDNQNLKNIQLNKQNSQAKIHREYQNRATSSVSLFFGVKAIGALVSAYFSGALLQFLSKKQIFLITAIFPFSLIFIAILLKEKKIDRLNLNDEQVINVKKCMVDFWTFFKNPLIYKPVLLIFCLMMHPSSSSIMFYFYTTVLLFTPEFLGELKFMYAAGSIIGVILYNCALKNLSIKKLFSVTSIFYFLCYQSLIILVTRKNVEWGIDDRIFCIGDSIMLHLVAELNMMPLLVLSCKMCPKNIEATMYAMLMSTMNLGSMVGTQLGSLLLLILDISENDFSRLWLFIIISGIFILLPLPWIYVIKEDQIITHRQKVVINQTDLPKNGNQFKVKSPMRENKNVFELEEDSALLRARNRDKAIDL